MQTSLIEVIEGHSGRSELWEEVGRGQTQMRCLCRAQRASWLRTTAGNLAVSAFRRNQAFRHRLPLPEARYRPPPADTHAQAIQAIALERWWQIVQGLPPQQHAVAAMRWLLGMNNCQIAERLGIKHDTLAASGRCRSGPLSNPT
jgi:hypothetical protein